MASLEVLCFALVWTATFIALVAFGLARWWLAAMGACVDALVVAELVSAVRARGDRRLLRLSARVELVARLVASLLFRRFAPRVRYADPRAAGLAKFMTAEQAAALIPRDGAVLLVTGIAGNSQPCSLYAAVRARFAAEQAPRGVTVISPSGIGGRGKGPGTLELLGVQGLTTRFFTAHAETFKAMLGLADRAALELQLVPQGVIALILRAMALRGETHFDSLTGKGTFFDPRVGRGTPLSPPDARQWVSVRAGAGAGGADVFRYELPQPTVALLNAPMADADGNLYVDTASVLCELADAAAAVRRAPGGGLVIVQVGRLLAPGERAPGAVYVPAAHVDVVVLNPATEQALAATHVRPFRALTLGYDRSEPIETALARMLWINRTAKFTPVRSAVDSAMARMALWWLLPRLAPGASLDIGTGLPEAIALALFEAAPSVLLEQLEVFTESGVIGGVPCPGAFFGASCHPRAMVASATIFERVYRSLDCVIVGALQFDRAGNVNVSRRGSGPLVSSAIGVGGFCDFTHAARTVVFVCPLFWKARVRLADGRLSVTGASADRAKFVPAVDEISFSGREALARGQRVLYVTDLGVFALSNAGVRLECIMPGVDVARDLIANLAEGLIVNAGAAPLVVPEQVVLGGRAFVPPALGSLALARA